MSDQAYAELHALSAFSFQRSVASPQALVAQAHALGYRAIAITDEVSLAGVVRAHEQTREHNIDLIVGSECHWQDPQLPGPVRLILLVTDHTGYSHLCQLISRARGRAPKGQYQLLAQDLDADLSGLLAIWKPDAGLDSAALDATAQWLKDRWHGRLWLGATRTLAPDDRWRFDALERLSQTHALPVVACGDVRMIQRNDQALLDVAWALAHHCTVQELGLNASSNAEQHLRPITTLQKLYPKAWLDETLNVATRCQFSLSELSYQYPKELVPTPLTASEHLRQLTERGLTERYGDQAPTSVKQLIEHELKLIEEMQVEAFFLTVHDLVCFAKARGILCQGRGSAANSAVCYCLQITEVDPAQQSLLFERFLSKERDEPPDIDVDFEHERREEVLQYIYQKYGRHRAALAATVITYRPKSALKDVGRALGFTADTLQRLTRSLTWWDQPDDWPKRLRASGLNPDDHLPQMLLRLARELIGLPRHLSQHVGGMVISDQPLHHLVPIENAAMNDRTIIQWDKDDLETLGLLKVDCLALGMLTVLRKTLQSIDPAMTLADIPKEDPATYGMLCRADAIGVFQVESRAQMAMLPRLKPQSFYDLVIEIAIVRPGPIQGDMVHPYLQRRQNPSRITYPNPALAKVLKRTLGVPIFQEQVMQIAMVAAGFTAGQADQLRRAMAAWKRRGGLGAFRDKLIEGMRQNGHSMAFAHQLYSQIEGFGDYGFPESHAASFALLTYFSAWLKCHHPAEFACALLNSQPMGFYAPAQIIADAKRHGVTFKPVSVQKSAWDGQVLQSVKPPGGIRLGFNQVKGLSSAVIDRLVDQRHQRPFLSIDDVVQRVGLNQQQLKALTESGALDGLTPDRRQAHWQSLASRRQDDLLGQAPLQEPAPDLADTPNTQRMIEEYSALGYSLDQHPIVWLRPHLSRMCLQADQLNDATRNHQTIDVVGLVTHRQRPSTASGVVFVSLEDETGLINAIVWPKIAARYHAALLQSQIIRIRGQLQQKQGSVHIIAQALYSEDARLASLMADERQSQDDSAGGRQGRITPS
ncbi:MAG: error-prone DNA polymerase [Wenzhouxiangella sp.]|nr:error-prone DNA polymerase [Wenzhouxiangella sp.]